MDNQDNNSRYHLHNIMSKDNQIIENVFRFKKVYIYISRSSSKIPDIVANDISHKLKIT